MANKDTGRTEPPQDHRAILIRCITRQLQRMNMGDLREAYTAVSKISDRTKKANVAGMISFLGNESACIMHSPHNQTFPKISP